MYFKPLFNYLDHGGKIRIHFYMTSASKLSFDMLIYNSQFIDQRIIKTDIITMDFPNNP